uniref:Uncharacterized protein n=1 Tax=Romanomermis culicivorax TaxID=13658 RepID=A0A915JXP7_ROMCU
MFFKRAWYRRNVELIGLAFKVHIYRFVGKLKVYSMSPDIPHCNDQPIVEMGGSIVNTPESPVPGDIEAPDNDTLSPTDLGYVALPTHDDSESRFIDNNVAVDSDFVSILDSNLAENGAVTNGSSENVIQRDRIPLSSVSGWKLELTEKVQLGLLWAPFRVGKTEDVQIRRMTRKDMSRITVYINEPSKSYEGNLAFQISKMQPASSNFYENVDKIKDLMSRLNIPSPPWAQSVPEDEWKSFLISRLALDR